MLGQGGWQDHPGMAYQAVIVEGDLDAVGVIRRQHLLGAPGQGQFGLSKTIIPEAKGNFLTPSNRRDAHLFGGLGFRGKGFTHCVPNAHIVVSTDMRSSGAMSTSVISDKGRILNATIRGFEDRYPNILHPNSCPSPPLRLPP